MISKKIFYIKANREKWYDEKYPELENLDWGLIQDNEHYEEGVLFSANKMIKEYFEQAREGDIILLHSTHNLNLNTKSKRKFVPDGRIVGVGLIKESIHPELGRDGFWISIQPKIIFSKQIRIRELDLNELGLNEIEPFKKGTNRFALTKLSEEEFNKLCELIINKNPEINDALNLLK